MESKKRRLPAPMTSPLRGARSSRNTGEKRAKGIQRRMLHGHGPDEVWRLLNMMNFQVGSLHEITSRSGESTNALVEFPSKRPCS